MKIYPKSFRPKWSFVKLIPDVMAGTESTGSSRKEKQEKNINTIFCNSVLNN
jgi:hypothetical protein